MILMILIIITLVLPQIVMHFYDCGLKFFQIFVLDQGSHRMTEHALFWTFEWQVCAPSVGVVRISNLVCHAHYSAFRITPIII